MNQYIEPQVIAKVNSVVFTEARAEVVDLIEGFLDRTCKASKKTQYDDSA